MVDLKSRKLSWQTPVKVSRLIAVLLLLLLFSSCATLPSANPPAKKNFLWEVSKGKSAVFLLGSIHVAKKDIYPLSPVIETAFDFSDTLAVEANVLAGESREAQILMLQEGSYPMWDSLSKNVSTETFKLINEKLAEIESPIRDVERFRPWMVSLLFTGIKLQQLGFTAENGIDVHFLKKAGGKKKIIELESTLEQLKILGSFSKKEEEDFLLYTLADLERVESQVGEMFDFWARGDPEGLNSVLMKFRKDRPGLSGIMKKLLGDRNERMVKKIEGFLSGGEGRYFVVVGAAHLVGEDGIIRMLKNKKYQVRQL